MKATAQEDRVARVWLAGLPVMTYGGGRNAPSGPVQSADE